MRFFFGEVFSFIIDTVGTVADIVITAGKNRLATQSTIIGNSGAHQVDVILEDGERKLVSKADVTVNSLRGFDPIADTWGFIGNEGDSLGVGADGDTIRTRFLAGDDASLFPAVDVTTTVVGGDTEDSLANRHVQDLNNDANYALRYFARRINTRAVTVYTTSREPGPQGERPNVNDFLFTATGTTVVSPAFDNIIRRQKNTSLARDPADPTLGILGISGSVTASEGDISGRFVDFAIDGGNDDLRVNGSVTPVDFFINALVDKEKFLTSMRFAMGGNGIQFGNFLSRNNPLGVGVEVTIRSNNAEFTFPAILTTEDFKNNFSLGAENFHLFDVAGTDHADATLSFPAPIQLFRQGTFGTDDFVRIRIKDNLLTGLSLFNFRAFGFTREF